MPKPNATGKLATCMIAATLLTALLTGCSGVFPSASSSADDSASPSSYMTSVNATSDKLAETLGQFAQATSNGDVFGMRSKADEAGAILEEISNIEAPESLSDVKDKYNDAANSLKQALADYIALYSEVDDGNFDFDTYQDRLEQIQKQYDDGLGALEEADKLASER